MLAAFAISIQPENREAFPLRVITELLTSGGISRADLQRLADLKRSFLSLARWCLDYTPRSQRTPAWEADFAQCGDGKASPLTYHEIKAVRDFPDNKARF